MVLLSVSLTLSVLMAVPSVPLTLSVLILLLSVPLTLSVLIVLLWLRRGKGMTVSLCCCGWGRGEGMTVTVCWWYCCVQPKGVQLKNAESWGSLSTNTTSTAARPIPNPNDTFAQFRKQAKEKEERVSNSGNALALSSLSLFCMDMEHNVHAAHRLFLLGINAEYSAIRSGVWGSLGDALDWLSWLTCFIQLQWLCFMVCRFWPAHSTVLFQMVCRFWPACCSVSRFWPAHWWCFRWCQGFDLPWDCRFWPAHWWCFRWCLGFDLPTVVFQMVSRFWPALRL